MWQRMMAIDVENQRVGLLDRTDAIRNGTPANKVEASQQKASDLATESVRCEYRRSQRGARQDPQRLQGETNSAVHARFSAPVKLRQRALVERLHETMSMSDAEQQAFKC